MTVTTDNGFSDVPAHPVNDSTRKFQLMKAIQAEVTKGGHVEDHTDFSAIVRYHKSTNHVLHLILTILTAGLWGLVWIAVYFINKAASKVVTLEVNEFGQVLRQEV